VCVNTVKAKYGDVKLNTANDDSDSSSSEEVEQVSLSTCVTFVLSFVVQSTKLGLCLQVA
jgi:hypothetical protein